MTSFEVDPDVLGSVADGLLASVDVARQVKDHRDSLKALASDAGDDTAQHAIHHFLDEWAYGCGCLIEDAEQMADRLGQTSRAYLETESKVTQAATIDGS
jgi:hypothetical protein